MNSSIKRHHIDLQDEAVLPVSKRGTAILSDPLLNKGTGFSVSERDELSLKGLVPPQVVSIDDQVRRVMENYRQKTSDLERYIHLEALHDRNETLYYREKIFSKKVYFPLAIYLLLLFYVFLLDNCKAISTLFYYSFLLFHKC